MKEVRYRIIHPTLGYFVSIKRTDNDSHKYNEKWSPDVSEADTFNREELRRPMDANNNGLMSLLVAGYGGLKLDEVKAPTLKLA